MQPGPTPSTMTSLAHWFAAGQGGRLAAAALLWLAVWALERVPQVGAWVNVRPTAKRGAAVVLAVAPGAAAALWAGVSLADVGQTAMTALLGATGLNVLLPTSPPAAPLDPEKLRATGALFVACAICSAFCAMLALAAFIPGCPM